MRESFLLTIFLSLFLTACGGGGGSSSSTDSVTTKTGIFLDAPVKGLAYKGEPSGEVGVTNTKGEFKYEEGDVVTFSMGSIVLGESEPDGNSEVRVTKLAKGALVAQLLQTLDIDPDSDGIDISGIEIPEAVVQAIINRLKLNDDSADIMTEEEFSEVKAGNSGLINKPKITSKEEVFDHIEGQIGGKGLTFSATNLNNRFLISPSIVFEHEGAIIRLDEPDLMGNSKARWIGVSGANSYYEKQLWSVNESGGLVFDIYDGQGGKENCTLTKLAEDAGSIDGKYICSWGEKGLKGFIKPQPLKASDFDGKTITWYDPEPISVKFDSGTYNCDAGSCIYKDGRYENSVWLAEGSDANVNAGAIFLLAQGDLTDGILLVIVYDENSKFKSVEIVKVSGDTFKLELESFAVDQSSVRGGGDDSGDSVDHPQELGAFTQNMFSDRTLYNVYFDEADGEPVIDTLVFDVDGSGQALEGVHDSISAPGVIFDYRVDDNGVLEFSNIEIDGQSINDQFIGLIEETPDFYVICWQESIEDLENSCNDPSAYELFFKTKEGFESELSH